jgi:hypothetical protein
MLRGQAYTAQPMQAVQPMQAAQPMQVYEPVYQYVENQSAGFSPSASSVAVVAMCAVVGYTIGAAATRAPASKASVESKPAMTAKDADLSQAMSKVEDLIKEMTSSPAVLKATLEKSERVQKLAREDPEIAAALKDPAMLAKEMDLLNGMGQMIRGMREAVVDPVKKLQIASQFKQAISQTVETAQVTARRGQRAPAPAMQLNPLTVNKKVIGFDQDGLFEGREIAQPKPPLKLLSRVQELRVLTTLADAGLLSKAQEAGVFSKLEEAGAFGLIEKTLPIIDKLGVLGGLEGALYVPANLQVFAALALLGGETGLILLIPDDNVALVAIQALTALVAGGGAVTLLASAYFFSLLQGEN